MRALRHQRFWTTATLFLAMLFGIGGLPAYAARCAQPSTVAAGAPSQGEVCQASQKRGCQCCAPHSRQSVSPATCHPMHSSGEGVHAARHCGCTLDAPANTPPATKAVGATTSTQAFALLPVPVIHFARSSTVGELPDGDDDPPPSDYRSSAPSRAPPAP